MGREVRMVPKDWQHPKDENGRFVPLLSGSFEEADREWNDGYKRWQEGFRRGYGPGEEWIPKDSDQKAMSYTQWNGSRPSPDDYMPNFPAADRTHYMMYEDTSEGTPISPAFATPEELAHWLADTNASAFGREGATYEQWLATIKRGWAVGAVLDENGFRSGVAMEG